MLFARLMEAVQGPPRKGVKSLGKPFRAWFGKSKAVDSRGRPLILFHGTKKPITRFSQSRMGTASNIFGSWQNERYGIFLAENPKLADEFATQGGQWVGSQVMPVYLRTVNPIDLTRALPDDLYKRIQSMVDDEARESGEDPEDPVSKKHNAGFNYARFIDRYAGSSKAWMLFDDDEGNDPKDVVRLFKKLGFDGAIFYEENAEGKNNRAWVAFDPNQVKSAIGNKGGFSPESDDIREGARPLTESTDAPVAWRLKTHRCEGKDYHDLEVSEGGSPPKDGETIELEGKLFLVKQTLNPKDYDKGRGGPIARYMRESHIAFICKLEQV